MSVVTCIKDNGKVWLAADGRLTANNSIIDETTQKIWSPQKNLVIGASGYYRAMNILQLVNDWVDESQETLTFEDVVESIVPKIYDVLIKGRFRDDKDVGLLDVTLIMAYKDRVYLIDQSAGVMEIARFGAIGCGRQYALGALEILCIRNDTYDCKDAVCVSVDAASVYDSAVNHKINYINTEDCELLLY